jgi:hypothetical protein
VAKQSWEVTVERAQPDATPQDLRKAELVRDRLEALDQVARTYPEGHDMRVLLDNLHLDQALGVVEEEIRTLRDTLIHPGGT